MAWGEFMVSVRVYISQSYREGVYHTQDELVIHRPGRCQRSGFIIKTEQKRGLLTVSRIRATRTPRTKSSAVPSSEPFGPPLPSLISPVAIGVHEHRPLLEECPVDDARDNAAGGEFGVENSSSERLLWLP